MTGLSDIAQSQSYQRAFRKADLPAQCVKFGSRINTRSLHILISRRFKCIFDTVLPSVMVYMLMSRAASPCSSGVKPNLYAWNTLIGVFGSVEDVDGAYQVWLNMLQSGVMPDMHTQVPCHPLACASSSAAAMHHMAMGVLNRAKPPMCLGRCRTVPCCH